MISDSELKLFSRGKFRAKDQRSVEKKAMAGAPKHIG